MNQYLVFLDIDGVFTSSRIELAYNYNEIWSSFDHNAVQFMNRIATLPNIDVKFVVSSTWRNEFVEEVPSIIPHWALATFRSSGFRGNFADPWKTNNHSGYFNRASEISEYIKTYDKDVKDYLIFDDTDYNFNNVLERKRFIKTDSHDGLLYKHMIKALTIIGEWK